MGPIGTNLIMSKGLHGYEFETYFKNISIVNRCFKDVVSLDEIPRSLNTKQFLIVNLSTKFEAGTHWFVILRSDKLIYEVFNSLGFNNLDQLLPYLKIRNRGDILFNEQQVQSTNSTTCGLFCIYFVVHRLLNLDLSFHHLFEDIFDDDETVNENKVIKFCDALKQNNANLFD